MKNSKNLLSIVLAMFALNGCVAVTKSITNYNDSPGGKSRQQAETEMIGVTPIADGKGKFDSPPIIVSSVLPDYSKQLKDAGIVGRVEVVFQVNKDGSVSNAIALGNPPKQLADLSVEAILKWRFKPATKNNEPVTVSLQVPFNFAVQ
jgi:periplasmic protein TonB